MSNSEHNDHVKQLSKRERKSESDLNLEKMLLNIELSTTTASPVLRVLCLRFELNSWFQLGSESDKSNRWLRYGQREAEWLVGCERAYELASKANFTLNVAFRDGSGIGS